MDKVRVLPDSVANQIAAGEVVGRPASVIKELVENAVDAGSKSITVRFVEGGRELIHVVDDGCGMSASDARLAFERHATSKINAADDLFRLCTFGFRGEALPSIASVAEVELRSRTAESELGTKVTIHGGRFVEQQTDHCPKGTQFLVKNLFYNVPARRRFLKEASKEASFCRTEFQRIALCNPDVAFALYNNDTPIYNLPAANLRGRIVGVIGKTITNNLLDLSVETSIVHMDGFVGRPAAAKQNNTEQYFFVNGRYFRSPYLHKAVMLAYEKLIPLKSQPSYFIYLTVAPERIDVNVHPTKTEIKFDDETAVWQILNAAVRESLAKLGMVPMMDFEIDSSFDIPVFKEGKPYKSPTMEVNPDFNPFLDSPTTPHSNAGSGAHYTNSSVPSDWEQLYAAPSAHDELKESEIEGFDASIMEFITGEEPEQGILEIESQGIGGLLHLDDRHIAVRLSSGLALVEINRAYERVLYERLVKMLGNNSAATQQLLFPEEITLSSNDFHQLQQIEEELSSLGFDLTLPTTNQVVVSGTPAGLTSGSIETTLLQILSESRDEGLSSSEKQQERMAAIMAHEMARSLNRNLGNTEAENLLDELFSCNNFSSTPFGKTIFTLITDHEIRKRLQ